MRKWNNNIYKKKKSCVKQPKELGNTGTNESNKDTSMFFINVIFNQNVIGTLKKK